MNKIVIEDSNIKNDFNVEKGNECIFNLINEKDCNNSLIFNLDDNSSAKINIFDASVSTNRTITINLNGTNSSVVLNLSVLSLGENTYEVNINHNNKNTNSNSNLHGLALKDNKIYFKNNGTIKHGSSKSDLQQDNKIIIMDNNDSKIEPNLFIDEYDISASHGAYVGKFKEEDIFYLKTRGLSEEESYNLLINGFLFGDFDIDKKENLIKIVDRYRG